MNIEQLRRLEKVNFPMGKIYKSMIDGKLEGDPTEKEMMEFVKNYIDEFYWDGVEWNFLFRPTDIAKHVMVQHIDLTECLVLACEAVLREDGGK